MTQATSATPQHARTSAVALFAAFVCGALIALQSRINGTLSQHSPRAVIAALWSFGSGLAILTVAVLLVPRLRSAVRDLPRAVRDGRLKWWQCLGGLVGGMLVAAQTWAVPVIGVAIFSVAVLGGQTLAAIGVDRAGLGSSGPHPVTPARVGFALLAVAGVVVSSLGHGVGSLAWLPVLVTFVAGAGIAVQQAVNARVNRAVGQPLATTWQNFLFGCVVLVGLALGSAITRPGAWGWPQGAPWWAWLGAPCGIAFIAITAWAVHELGVLLFGLGSVAGQLLTALGLDLADPAVRPDIGTPVVVGVVISLLAALGAGVAARR